MWVVLATCVGASGILREADADKRIPRKTNGVLNHGFFSAPALRFLQRRTIGNRDQGTNLLSHLMAGGTISPNQFENARAARVTLQHLHGMGVLETDRDGHNDAEYRVSKFGEQHLPKIAENLERLTDYEFDSREAWEQPAQVLGKVVESSGYQLVTQNRQNRSLAEHLFLDGYVTAPLLRLTGDLRVNSRDLSVREHLIDNGEIKLDDVVDADREHVAAMFDGLQAVCETHGFDFGSFVDGDKTNYRVTEEGRMVLERSSRMSDLQTSYDMLARQDQLDELHDGTVPFATRHNEPNFRGAGGATREWSMAFEERIVDKLVAENFDADGVTPKPGKSVPALLSIGAGSGTRELASWEGRDAPLRFLISDYGSVDIPRAKFHSSAVWDDKGHRLPPDFFTADISDPTTLRTQLDRLGLTRVDLLTFDFIAQEVTGDEFAATHGAAVDLTDLFRGFTGIANMIAFKETPHIPAAVLARQVTDGTMGELSHAAAYQYWNDASGQGDSLREEIVAAIEASGAWEIVRWPEFKVNSQGTIDGEKAYFLYEGFVLRAKAAASDLVN